MRNETGPIYGPGGCISESAKLRYADAPRDKPEIEIFLNSLDGTASNLAHSVDALVSRLSPVLGTGRLPTADANPAQAQGESPMGARLAVLLQELNVQVHRLNTLQQELML